MANLPFDINAVRADFPILASKVNGQPLCYLDSGASAQKPRTVLAAMQNFYETSYANVHRGVHSLSARATAQFEAARETVRAFIHAREAREIIFTKGATEAINLVAHGLIKPGDEVVVSQLEHHANIVPWQLCGAALKVASLKPDGQLDLDALKALLSPRTKLVAISHVSNTLGTVLPVAAVIAAAHAQNIPVLVDGCQAAVHLSLDMQALDADFYVFSGHKIYGPTGIGVLYGRAERLTALPPYQGGGDMIEEVSFSGSTYKDIPARFEAGTPPIVEAVGLAAALDYMSTLGMDNIHAHEQALADYARQKLAVVPELTLYGTAPDKVAIFSFNLAGAHPADVATLLDQQGIAVRAGHHCCMPLMNYLGVSGTCRASFALYNSFDEVDALVAGLAKAARLLA